MAEYRVEHDSMGDVRVPADALWGAQTQRAVENFPISGKTLERKHIEALARVKKAAAGININLSFGTGVTYTVKFDGPEATVPDSGGMTVTGQRADDHTVALTYKRKGEVLTKRTSRATRMPNRCR